MIYVWLAGYVSTIDPIGELLLVLQTHSSDALDIYLDGMYMSDWRYWQ